MSNIFLNAIILIIILFSSFEFIETSIGFKFPSGIKHLFLFGLTSIVLLVKKSKTTIPKKYFFALLLIFFFVFLTALINNNSAIKSIQGLFFTFLFSYVFIVFSRLKFTKEQLNDFLKKLLVVLFILIIIAPAEALLTGTSLRWAC